MNRTSESPKKRGSASAGDPSPMNHPRSLATSARLRDRRRWTSPKASDGQPTLFDRGERNPLSRSSDPITSRFAERALKESGKHQSQLARALEALRANPDSTSLELGAAAGNSDRYLFSRRLPDLEKRGLIVRAGVRECRVSGKISITWRANA